MISLLLLFFTQQQSWSAIAQTPEYYAPNSGEFEVSFNALAITKEKSLFEVRSWNLSQRSDFENNELPVLLKYLAGPLTARNWGAPSKKSVTQVKWNDVYSKNGKIFIPYTYKGKWTLFDGITSATSISLPLPFNSETLYSPQWQKCGDNSNQPSSSFFWYLWDPTRYGCDQVEGEHFQTINVALGHATPESPLSYPEYSRLIRLENGVPTLRATFAFGYYQGLNDANPDMDLDPGAQEYRAFRFKLHKTKLWEETPILLKEYKGILDKVIGTRFTAQIDGVRFIVSVVIDSDLSTFEIFSKSFAHDHDGFFAWLGHSQLGAAFNKADFLVLEQKFPNQFKITSDYQIVYWGGCSGYTYYSEPLMELKGGTQNLDLISNSLQNWFNFMADEASVSLNQLMHFKQNPSYQAWMGEIEAIAEKQNSRILISVLGDEDNPKPKQ